MADFHFNFVKKKWKNPQLCFTDTDSLLYELETDDVFADISKDVDTWFDTSDMPPNHPSGIAGKNKKVLGMMKDEACGRNILEFVGLRAKLYSFIFHGGGGKQKAKGVKKKVVKQTITHEDFKRTLITGKSQMRVMKCIRSEKHTIFTQKIHKIALSADDDKRHVMKDGIHNSCFGSLAVAWKVISFHK